MPQVCPQCHAPVQQVGKFFVCPEHGPIDPIDVVDEPTPDAPSASLPRPKVFISYGRADAKELVDRLCVDLAKAGFDVWRDTQEIRAGADWQAQILDGLRSAQVVIAVMSPHAVRTSTTSTDQVDSVCLSEIAYALYDPPPRRVVPVMAASCKPPLFLYQLDYVDLRSWNSSDDQYRTGLTRLIDGLRAALRGDPPRYHSWCHQLQAFDFAPFLFSRQQYFVGRQWLFDAIDAWRADPAAKPALLVRGDAGVGKSAIVADLVRRNPNQQVLAYHCCQWNLPATLDAHRFVRSLAAMIASKSDAFAERLGQDEEIRRKLADETNAEDPRSLLAEAILAPLQSLPAPEGGLCYLLVDALDEALLAPPGNRTIVEVLSANLDKLPPWLRVVATTRNEPLVLSRLRGLQPAEIDAHSPDNLADLRRYLDLRLAQRNMQERLIQARRSAADIEQLLLARSEGNFLYVQQALDDFDAGLLTAEQLASLPPGLAGLYENRFAEQFPDEVSFAGPERVFEVLAAAKEPLAEPQLAAATGLEPFKELPNVLAKLQQYLRVVAGAPAEMNSAVSPASRSQRYTFYHKSLSDWLSHPDRRGQPRWIEPQLGHQRLAEVGWVDYQHGVAQLSPYHLRYLPMHLTAAERWDDLERVLTNLEYYEAKNSVGLVFSLAGDLSAAWQALPEDRPQRRIIELLEVALRRDIHFIHQHREDYPQGLFQSLWNHGWWYDCPESDTHYEPTANPRTPSSDGGLSRLLNSWLTNKKELAPFTWLRSVRAPPIPLDSAQLKEFKGTGSGITCLAASPSQEWLASGSFDCTVRLWCGMSGQEIQSFHGHEGRVTAMAFSRSGNLLASGSTDSTVRIWGLTNISRRCTITADQKAVNSIAFVPWDEELVAFSGASRVIRITNVNSGESVTEIPGHEGRVLSLAFSPTDHWLASCDTEGMIRVWNLENENRSIWSYCHAAELRTLAWSACGKWLLAGGGDGHVLMFNGKSGELFRELAAHDGAVIGLCVLPAHHDACFVSGSWDQTIKVWNLDTGQRLAAYQGHERAITSLAVLARDGRAILASGSEDSTIRLWDGANRSAVPQLLGHKQPILSISFSTDGKSIISGACDETVREWHADSGYMVHILASHENVVAVACTAEHNIILAGSQFGTVRVWNSATCQEIRCLRKHESRTTCLAVSPDGRYVLSGAADGTAHVWDIHTGDDLLRLPPHESEIRRVAFLSGGRQLVTESTREASPFIQLWDATTGNLLRTLGLEANVEALIAGEELPPFRVVVTETSTAIKDVLHGAVLAAIPVRLRPYAVDYRSSTLTGAVENHLYIYRLER